jgi:drug/metabolite transporter (DMT)-like permease
LSFVFATFAAILFLGEHVSTVRWIGVALIVLGAGFISYSEKLGDRSKAPTPVNSSSVSPGAQ